MSRCSTFASSAPNSSNSFLEELEIHPDQVSRTDPDYEGLEDDASSGVTDPSADEDDLGAVPVSLAQWRVLSRESGQQTGRASANWTNGRVLNPTG